MDKMTIICIDDENIVLRSLKNELMYIFSDTFSVESAESGQEALEILEELTEKEAEIPVVICDYIMPGMKGDEVLEKIHNLYPDIITVMLTGRAVTQGVINAVNKACLFRYIEKPWTKNTLEATVRSAVDLYQTNKKSKEERENLLNKKKQLSSEALKKRSELLEVKERLSNANVPADLNSFYLYLKLINEIRTSFGIGKSDLLRSSGTKSGEEEMQLEALFKQLPEFEEMDRILLNIEKAKSGAFSEERLASLQDINSCMEKIVKQIGKILDKDIL